MNREITPSVRESAAKVRVLVLDVDGVLTDGSLYLGDNEVEYKAFYSRDGHGMKLLMASGVQLAVITGRRSKVVTDRMAALGITHVYQGDDQKEPVFDALLEKLSLAPEQAAYVGDDLVDLPVMRRCGLSVAVADADPRVGRAAMFSTRCAGGRGAVREVCELILDAQDNLHDALAPWLGEK
ncbi:MAG: 3-deoxy-D-manno-octulosonate 8-phosphate phosphatase (KDO 8-P phosphatase) [Gammaproteobacteria bacterium]|jgi:3-deoxy-D-manno-octulosonate 8-phosphate phosphatase (KDO 8-P phosphatase)